MTVAALDALVDELEVEPKLGRQLVHRAYLPGQPSCYGELEPPLPDGLVRGLASLGIERLFSHQVEGLDAARRGENVLVTTPTASGKSLVYQLPVLEEAMLGRPGRALFLFPLKALGQDQRSKLDRLRQAAGLPVEQAGCAIYDGDTPRPERERIRHTPPRVLISNPDMLHLGILGNAAAWAPFLGELRWIVIDELHTYRGIFGSHFHHVLQRLLRLCRRFGAEPAVVASSATASNAAEFAQRLTTRAFHRVERSGAAREGRHFLLFQPQTSPYTTTLDLLVRLLEAELKTIVFTKARRITELLHSWLRQGHPQLADRVANYRAGFLPGERRQIELDLFEGRLAGVISTSALELGIDVGGLDACILVGFPGSMMATWQRSGRVGREGRESITALVALPDALDQYLLQNPDAFLSRECEPLVVSPGNETVASPHLLCAAAELPLEREADRDYLARHAPLVDDLVRGFALASSEDGKLLHCLRAAPHRELSLRGSGATYTIESTVSGRPVGTVDGVRVLRECHPGAIYLHAGRQYLITELDLEYRRVSAEPARVEYFTVPQTEKRTTILELLDEAREGPLRSWLGRVRVTERVVGFERKKILSQERLGEEPLELPPVEFETVALWFAAPRDLEETLREHAEDFMGALHAAEHAAISLFPVLALCDRGDLGGVSIPFHPQVGTGAIFLYDGHGGGAGIAESGFARLPELLGRVADLLEHCSCEGGCPSCIQSPKCGNGNRPLDKSGARRLVRLLLAREEPVAVPGGVALPEIRLIETDESAAAAAGASARRTAVPESPPPRVFRWSAAGIQAAGAPRRLPDLFDLEQPLPEEITARGAHAGPGAALSTASTPSRDSEGRPALRRRAPLPRRSERTLLFDVETKRSAEEVGGWHRLHRLGVALAVALELEENRFRTYHEHEVQELIVKLRSADLVVGFNVLRFDYPVLSGYSGEDFRRTLPTLDLFEQVEHTVGTRLGLGHLARATFGAEKSADGLQSLEWYRQGRLDLIAEYCRRDVELLRDLYLFGRREGYVCCASPLRENGKGEDGDGESPERIVRVPVEWL